MCVLAFILSCCAERQSPLLIVFMCLPLRVCFRLHLLCNVNLFLLALLQQLRRSAALGESGLPAAILRLACARAHGRIALRRQSLNIAQWHLLLSLKKERLREAKKEDRKKHPSLENAQSSARGLPARWENTDWERSSAHASTEKTSVKQESAVAAHKTAANGRAGRVALEARSPERRRNARMSEKSGSAEVSSIF